MDKRLIMKQIIEELNKNKCGTLKGKPFISGKDLDILIYSKSGRMDKNLKYEFRSFLKTYGIIQAPSVLPQQEGFIIDKKNIENFLKGLE